jgi:hypothetical protein
VAPGGETWAARPLDPIDFEVRPGIPHSSWPFDRAHLHPYDAQDPGLCQLGPFDDDPGRWADQTRTPRLRLPPGAVETTLFHRGTAGFEGHYLELVLAPNITLLLRASVVQRATGEDPAGWTKRWLVARTIATAADGVVGSSRSEVFACRAAVAAIVWPSIDGKSRPGCCSAKSMRFEPSDATSHGLVGSPGCSAAGVARVVFS